MVSFRSVLDALHRASTLVQHVGANEHGKPIETGIVSWNRSIPHQTPFVVKETRPPSCFDFANQHSYQRSRDAQRAPEEAKERPCRPRMHEDSQQPQRRRPTPVAGDEVGERGTHVPVDLVRKAPSMIDFAMTRRLNSSGPMDVSNDSARNRNAATMAMANATNSTRTLDGYSRQALLEKSGALPIPPSASQRRRAVDRTPGTADCLGGTCAVRHFASRIRGSSAIHGTTPGRK